MVMKLMVWKEKFEREVSSEEEKQPQFGVAKQFSEMSGAEAKIC